MKYFFAPGCALAIYKPHIIDRIFQFLTQRLNHVEILQTCCKHTPLIPKGVKVINICPGCDRRFRENYENPSCISLWELLLEDGTFPFPDYKSQKMTIIDACPTRDQDRIHQSIRSLAQKMNITIIEPLRTKRTSTCCGDSLYGKVPTSQVINQMEKKAAEMPPHDIIVYCVSCCKSMFIGGKQPRYIVDLLFNEETIPATTHPDAWHNELDVFIDSH